MHYLDNAATTPVRPEAVAAAVEAMTTGWGNPSSRHALGARAADRLRAWRQDTADTLGCDRGEVYFTSCGTESDNWAIRGAVEVSRRRGKHIITTAIEHDGVLGPCRDLERQGYEVTYLRPRRDGTVDPGDVAAVLRADTVLVSMMLVNNELGTLLPVAQTAQAIRAAGSAALLHCDGVQALFKIPFSLQELGVDLFTVSGHKIHAPKGIGALFVRRGVKLPPLILGGGQEEGLRSGTEPTAQIAAFAAALRAGRATAQKDMAHMAAIKDYALDQLERRVPQVEVLCRGGAPHILPISLPGYKSEVVVRFLSERGVCLSSGSACHKGRPSHVFAALKLQKALRDGALRASFSYDTQKADVDALVDGLSAAREQLFPTLS